MKNPTAEELAVLRERAERTFSRFPVLPRREDGRMSPESRLRFELTLETILEKNRALGACVVLRRPSGAHETFCFGTARLLGRVPVTEETCFRVASVSKLVMTFGALALVERGVLGQGNTAAARYSLVVTCSLSSGPTVPMKAEETDNCRLFSVFAAGHVSALLPAVST